jgi:fatty acid desaturase
MTIYRDEHNRHHRFLGDPARDPDFIHDETRLRRGWLAVWLDQIRSPRMFCGAVLGHIDRLDAGSFAAVACWWAAVLGLIAFASNGANAVIFFSLWIAARATAFHAITAFREISDHVGLETGSVVGFCRNHTAAGLAGQLFHPHNNGYHLLHHLTPGVPFHALPRAHAILLRWPRYAQAEQCNAYFSGERSAVRSWVWRWTDARAGHA